MTVVFFCPNILRDAHRRIFQLDRLKKEKINFIFLDATQFYGHQSTATDDLILSNRQICKEVEDFVRFRGRIGESPVLYVSFDQYMKFAAPVLNILVRKKDKLLTYHTKRFSSVHIPTGRTRIILNSVLRKLDNFLPIHLWKFWYKKRHGLFIPDYFLCSTEYLIPTKIFLSVKKENRFIVHSDDINQTIEPKPAVIQDNRKIGVFLDQMMPYQTILHANIEQEEPPEDYKNFYYKQLRKSLVQGKSKLGLDEIVIALHPDAVKYTGEVETNFKDFRTFLGATHELIRDCEVVFAHSSTALGWAIYYKKPVILLKENYLMRQLMGDYIRFFESRLNMASINMNNPEENGKVEAFIDLEKYESYAQKFLKDNDIQENSYFYAIKRIQESMH